MGRENGNGSCEELPPKLQRAMGVLLEASDYARRTTRDPWEFAVEIQQLQSMGLSANDLRFLVRKGLVEHARETTVVGQDGRYFQPTGDLTFTKHTCFIVTCNGATPAGVCEQGAGDSNRSDGHTSRAGEAAASSSESVTPQWNAEKRELWLGDRLVKRFKWHAENQERVLAAFEEEAWPFRVDDPLPPHGEQDAKRRLSDTIKCLNRKQIHPILHFRGDGTGEGVVWELVDREG